MRVCLVVTILILNSNWINAQETSKNIIKGTVIPPKVEQKIVKGSGYNKDGTSIMHSDDPLAKMENNIIIVAHPLSFVATLKPTPNATITQKAQTFIPHILPITKKSTVYFLNEDQFFHNVYSLTPGAKFNIGRRPPGSPYPLEIKKSGIITLSCDIHPHMKSYILSLETPYFTRADEAGNYELSGLPDGEYRIAVFYALPNKIEKVIQLKNGEVITMDFDLTKEKKP